MGLSKSKMSLFAKTKQDYFLKEIGRKLLDTEIHGPHEILENEEEQDFYLNFKNHRISIPILEGYKEKAEERAFDDDTSLDAGHRKSRFAKEAVRALSLIGVIANIRKITESEGKKDLVSKVNAEIISIGDKANKFRSEYALKEIMYGIDFSVVPFAYNRANGTTERKLETAEKIIESSDFIFDLSENILALYLNIGTKYAQRIAEKLSEQYLKPMESFEGEYGYKQSMEKVLKITKELHEKKEGLFKKMGKFLDKELLARVKYPKSRITMLEGKVIVIPEDKEKIIIIDDKEKELVTKLA